jgi:hypothetical protein
MIKPIKQKCRCGLEFDNLIQLMNHSISCDKKVVWKSKIHSGNLMKFKVNSYFD